MATLFLFSLFRCPVTILVATDGEKYKNLHKHLIISYHITILVKIFDSISYYLKILTNRNFLLDDNIKLFYTDNILKFISNNKNFDTL